MSLLQPEHWQQRSVLCQKLAHGIQHNDMLSLLPAIHHDKAIESMGWLLGLLADSMKLQQHAAQFCLNQDQLPLVSVLASRMTNTQLFEVYEAWQNCCQLIDDSACTESRVTFDKSIITMGSINCYPNTIKKSEICL